MDLWYFKYKLKKWLKSHLLFGKRKIRRGIDLYRRCKISKDVLYKKYIKTEKREHKYRGEIVRASVERNAWEHYYKYGYI